MNFTENVLYTVSIFNKVFDNLNQEKLFNNKDFTFIGKPYVDNITLTLVKDDMIRLDIVIEEDGLEIHIDKTAETFCFNLKFIKNNEEFIKNIIKMIFLSKIKVEYCGKKYTKLYFINKHGIVIDTFTFRNSIWGLFISKRNCIEKIYVPIYSF